MTRFDMKLQMFYSETLSWPKRTWGRQPGKKTDFRKTNDAVSESSCDPWTLNCLTLSYSPHLNYPRKLRMIEWAELTNKRKAFLSRPSLHFLPIIFALAWIENVVFEVVLPRAETAVLWWPMFYHSMLPHTFRHTHSLTHATNAYAPTWPI